jgi:hypothetical protein
VTRDRRVYVIEEWKTIVVAYTTVQAALLAEKKAKYVLAMIETQM